jgi:pyruvate/2-oxoglutarate dehydrogenase complex dihydrolipoamide dehydrogenase (E3) component
VAGFDYDLVIVGMGSAGMVAAEFASTLDIKVAAVERDRVGGDCLWTGCVPSKALLASAKAAHIIRHAERYGLPAAPSELGPIDTAPVFARIRAIQDQLAASDDDPQRFVDAGVDMHFGAARLTGPHTVAVEGVGDLRARFVLLCTGSRPAAPPIDGLAEAGFLTSETLWAVERAPESLVVIGGGPIAIELAQGFTRLGVPATVLERDPAILGREEPDLAARLRGRLADEGVEIVTGVEISSAGVEDARKVVHGTVGGDAREWRAAEIVVAAGRAPNVDRLGLDEVGVETGPRGVVVDGSLRTSVKSVFAAGDVAGRFLFTHSAGYEAAAAVRTMFFPGSGDAPDAVPWCTFTDPELAHAGMTEAQARAEHGDDDVRVWIHELTHSDRARAEGDADGEIRIVTANGRIVGGHALCASAGELIHELALAIHDRRKLTELAGLVHVYPTLAIGIGQLAGEAAYERAGRLGFLVRSKT